MTSTRALAFLVASVLGGAAGATAQVVPSPPIVPDVHVAAADAALLRLFLEDGTSLVSYGEFTRMDDRVVFSMPTSASATEPRLHLVNIATRHVDWDRTERYAESARAARYVAIHAETHYAMLSAEIGQALNDVALTTDPAARLAIVERARKTLADWPAAHFNYKADEIHQMLAILDEAIADLRAAAGGSQFDLSFVTSLDRAPEREPLLPRPTLREAIEQTLTAARLSDSPVERVSLMTVALAGIERDAERLPSAWTVATRAAIRAGLAVEVETDRRYQSLTSRTVGLARQRARAADVRGLERLLAQIHEQDEALGRRRPDAVRALVSTVAEHLESARTLLLTRDRWALRLPELTKYHAALAGPVARLDQLTRALEDIKAMAGSTPAVLASVERSGRQVLEIVAPLAPPEEFRAAHTLLVSAAQLAASAARIRREAALTGDLTRAWDASSAAAGALMLTVRARTEIQTVLSSPQLLQ
jgi:hypothetical protein